MADLRRSYGAHDTSRDAPLTPKVVKCTNAHATLEFGILGSGLEASQNSSPFCTLITRGRQPVGTTPHIFGLPIFWIK
jgi:hypothetical protein